MTTAARAQPSRGGLPPGARSTIVHSTLMAARDPEELADAELARLIAARGADAVRCEAELCRRFAPRVRLYGMRHLRSAAPADDLVQRVLMIAIEKLRADLVREPDRIGSFLLGTARTLVRDQQRSDRLVPVETVPDAAVAGHAPDPALRNALAGCVERLGERERAIVVLSLFQEQDAAEIGAVLGMQAGHVRVTRHRALAQLRSCLGRADEGET